MVVDLKGSLRQLYLVMKEQIFGETSSAILVEVNVSELFFPLSSSSRTSCVSIINLVQSLKTILPF